MVIVVVNVGRVAYRIDGFFQRQAEGVVNGCQTDSACGVIVPDFFSNIGGCRTVSVVGIHIFSGCLINAGTDDHCEKSRGRKNAEQRQNKYKIKHMTIGFLNVHSSASSEIMVISGIISMRWAGNQ